MLALLFVCGLPYVILSAPMLIDKMIHDAPVAAAELVRPAAIALGGLALGYGSVRYVNWYRSFPMGQMRLWLAPTALAGALETAPRGWSTGVTAVLMTALVTAALRWRVPGSSAATPAITEAPALRLDASAVTTVATGLRIPWGLAFLPDGTALVTERGNPGYDGIGTAQILSVTPTGTVTEVQRLREVDLSSGGGGLLGIAVSPTCTSDRWVYVYYSAVDDNRIARLRLGQRPEPIVTGIPVARGGGDRYQQGGRLAFGPDGMLYASVDETYVDSEIAQDLNSQAGRSCA